MFKNLDNLKKIHSNQSVSKVQAEENAIELLKQASQRIPAYKDFLKKNNIDINNVSQGKDLEQIPYTTKENYIQEYPLKSLCWDGDPTKANSIAASSGSTGQPLFWPRQIDQDISGARIHRIMFENIFKTNNKKTLFVNAFGLGNWIAGMYTHSCAYLVNLSGSPLTIASPGFNEEEVFKIIRNFSHLFEQTIIASHPPVLRIMLENGIKAGIDWQKLNIRLLGAGEGFSESFRDYLLSLLDGQDSHSNFINIYGSADAGLIGHESPYTIKLHRDTQTDTVLNQALFESERHPYIYQFDPLFKFVESQNEELIITANSTLPLLRYNTHDHGAVLYPDDIEKISPKYKDPEIQEPIIYMFGRKGALLSMMAVNIYPENLKMVIEHQKFMPILSGRFIATKEHDSNHQPFIQLIVELKKGVKDDESLERRFKRLFVKILKESNSEYDQVESRFGKLMHPIVNFVKFEHQKYFPKGKIKKMS